MQLFSRKHQPTWHPLPREKGQRGEPVQPRYFSEALIRESAGRLATGLDRPFNDRVALRHLLILGSQLAPFLDRYDTVVAEGFRGTIAAAAIWHAVNAARTTKHKEPAALRFADGNFAGVPLPSRRYFSPRWRPERLLLVTEITGEGDHISNALLTIEQGRNMAQVDVATVGTSTNDWDLVRLPGLDGGTFFWHPGSTGVDGPLYVSAARIPLEIAEQDRSAQILGAAIFGLAQVSGVQPK